mgnify:CR=1 FL=1
MYNEFQDHLVSSILVTIFCCLPFGIPAIVPRLHFLRP